jgi:uncharacterized protein (DUF1330 family)
MPAYIVVQIDVHDPLLYDEYKLAAQATLARYGGRYIVRGGPVTELEGPWNPKRFVVLEFPDKERARAWYDSPEYGPPKAIRHASASSRMILVEGGGP